MINKTLSLGRCKLKYTLSDETIVSIEATEKESDVSLSLTTETFGVQIDQGIGDYESRTNIAEAKLTASFGIDKELLPKICSAYEVGGTGIAIDGIGKATTVGALEIHPIEMGTDKSMDINVPKAWCKVDASISYKKDGKALVTAEFNFATDMKEDSVTYGKLLTIGEYVKSDS